MRLAFVDFIYHYDAARPDTDAPLGGTTSAVCFLARALVTSGVSCTFFNRVETPCEALGIPTLPLDALGDAVSRGLFDAYIFCGRWTAELVDLVRAHTQAPLIAWMHESVFAAPMTPALDAFDGVAFVSVWQQKLNQNAVKPHWRQAVLRNAMNPVVAQAYAANESILESKAKPPLLLFAGSFARGAFHVPPLLEKIREKRRDFSVEMFCNLDPSRNPVQDAAYVQWLKEQPNITHIGMVGQGELARRMRRASVMLAPNSWPETSCISLIEGLASGLEVVATDRAALPETAAGFARHVSLEAPDDPSRFDQAVDYDAFAALVLAALHEREVAPDAVEARLHRQIEYFQRNYQWDQRVEDWLRFVRALCAGKQGTPA